MVDFFELKIHASKSLLPSDDFIQEAAVKLREEFGDAIFLGTLEGVEIAKETQLDAGLSPEGRDWVADASELQATFYFSNREAAEAATLILELDQLQVQFEILKQAERDWNEDWRKSFLGLEVGFDFQIIPSWQEDIHPKKNLTPILISPGMGFGTGSHPTTYLCLQQLASCVKPGDRIFDFGSGSGILSIGALKKAAKFAELVEIDPAANLNAEENFKLNQISSEAFRIQEQASFEGAKFDIVVANIVLQVLLEYRDFLCSMLAPKASLILSGVLNDQLSELKDSFSLSLQEKSVRFEMQEEHREGWSVLVFRCHP